MVGDALVVGRGGETASILAIGDVLATDTVYAEKGGKHINGVWKTRQKPNPVWHGLPEEYQEVEYLESTGVQWIDTLLPDGSANDRFEVAARVLFLDAANEQDVLGVYTSNNLRRYIGCNNNNVRLMSFGNAVSNIIMVPIDTQNPKIIHATQESGYQKLTVDEVSNTGSATGSGSSDTNLYMFARHGGSMAENFLIGRIYNLKIRVNNSDVRDFIPCYRISDNKPGMYDLVNGVFYVNQGTGADFTVGTDVPQFIDGFEIAPVREYGTWEVTAKRAGRTDFFTLVRVDAAEQFTVEVSA